MIKISPTALVKIMLTNQLTFTIERAEQIREGFAVRFLAPSAEGMGSHQYNKELSEDLKKDRQSTNNRILCHYDFNKHELLSCNIALLEIIEKAIKAILKTVNNED